MHDSAVYAIVIFCLCYWHFLEKKQKMTDMPKYSSAKQAPQAVKLTAEEAESLRQRVCNNELTPEDRQLLLGLISFSLWLQQRLTSAKIKIKQLKKLFGFRREKKSVDSEAKKASDKAEVVETDTSSATDELSCSAPCEPTPPENALCDNQGGCMNNVIEVIFSDFMVGHLIKIFSGSFFMASKLQIANPNTFI